MRNLTFCLLAAFFFVACASSTGTKSPRRSTNLITAEEIAASTARDAYEAIQLLRPSWLVTRGIASPNNPRSTVPTAYINNSRLGDIENLRNVSAISIAEIRLLSPNDATTLYGTGNVGGAIMVKTK
ncbi:hypothetical protein L0337_07395 [candidate division KSB1 bacterium]|nr:hypothetical protein [candidate division KSB1 bacterium]